MLLEWARPEVWRPWVSSALTPGLPQTDVVRRLKDRFRALRAFHAARPKDIAPYYRCGIQPLSRGRWQELVAECFLSRVQSLALTAAIAQARDVQFDMVRAGRVHFCCDERMLEERDGYHLIYGSLSLLAVAIQIDKEFGTHLKAALRARGEPVIFVCDIPTAMVEDEVLARLVACLSEAHARAAESGSPVAPPGLHFSLPGALPAGAIVGHRRPRYVVDAVYGHHLGVRLS